MCQGWTERTVSWVIVLKQGTPSASVTQFRPSLLGGSVVSQVGTFCVWVLPPRNLPIFSVQGTGLSLIILISQSQLLSPVLCLKLWMCEFSFLSKLYAFHIFLFPVFLPLSVDMDNNSDPNLYHYLTAVLFWNSFYQTSWSMTFKNSAFLDFSGQGQSDSQLECHISSL